MAKDLKRHFFFKEDIRKAKRYMKMISQSYRKKLAEYISFNRSWWGDSQEGGRNSAFVLLHLYVL